MKPTDMPVRRASQPRIAVVGAGMSGLSAARQLSDRFSVTVFDKSRGVGGRMSTRYADAYEFDHGAQYFTARDPGFKAEVERGVADGHLAPWAGRFLYLKGGQLSRDRGGDRYVGTPRMNSWPKALASGLDVHLGKRVSRIACDQTWTLEFEDGDVAESFAALILAIPATQARDLVRAGFADRAALDRVRMNACFALMLGLETPHDFGFDTLRVDGLPLDWISVNSAKPGRADTPQTIMIHSEAAWSNAHVDADRDWLAAQLIASASELCRVDLGQAPHRVLHRWLYSSVAENADKTVLWDEQLNLAICGDWGPGGRVEGAWASGMAAAGTVERALI